MAEHSRVFTGTAAGSSLALQIRSPLQPTCLNSVMGAIHFTSIGYLHFE